MTTRVISGGMSFDAYAWFCCSWARLGHYIRIRAAARGEQ